MFAKYKAYLIGAWLVIWAVLLMNTLGSNPSVADARAKLTLMQVEMDALLQEGGKVVNGSSNSKYGGAFLDSLLSDEGWSDALLQRYRTRLVSRQWAEIGINPITYCKDGILLTMKPNYAVIDGVGTNYVGMVYNAFTIKQCRNRES